MLAAKNFELVISCQVVQKCDKFNKNNLAGMERKVSSIHHWHSVELCLILLRAVLKFTVN